MYPADYTEEKAQELMKKALEMGIQAYEENEVPVGCIFVDRTSKKIIAAAGNRSNQTKDSLQHCEFICFDQILQNNQNLDNFEHTDFFKSIDVWVTCEPCIMCSAAFKLAGISRCIYGCKNDKFGGCGTVLDLTEINNTKLECYSGLFEKEAISILQKFYARGNPKVIALGKKPNRRVY